MNSLARVKVLFGDADRRRVEEVLFLVDTGAYSPIIPPSLAKGFQIEILAKIELTSTDERKTGKRRCNGASDNC